MNFANFAIILSLKNVTVECLLSTVSQDPFETWTNGDDHKDLPTSSKYGVALAASLSAVVLLILLILLIIVLVNWIKRRNESYHKEGNYENKVQCYGSMDQ